MKHQFMLLFRFQPDPSYQPSEEDEQQQKEAWGKFFGNLGGSGHLVATDQLGFEGIQIQHDGTTTDGINIAEGRTLGGYAIVNAESIQQASVLAKDCPILQMGGNVEVRSIIPTEANN